MRTTVIALVVSVALTAAVGGCAVEPLASPSVAGVSSPSPSSVACPQVDEEPLPPECIPYDPQALMDSNNRYRERLPVQPDAFAAFEAERAGITVAIEELQADEGLNPEAVREILIDAGLQLETSEGVNAFEKDGEIVFNGVGPMGGCVFGTVSPTSFEIDIRGVIMDGGCYEALSY